MSWLQSPCTKVLLWTVFNVTESDIVAGQFDCLFGEGSDNPVGCRSMSLAFLGMVLTGYSFIGCKNQFPISTEIALIEAMPTAPSWIDDCLGIPRHSPYLAVNPTSPTLRDSIYELQSHIGIVRRMPVSLGYWIQSSQ